MSYCDGDDPGNSGATILGLPELLALVLIICGAVLALGRVA